MRKAGIRVALVLAMLILVIGLTIRYFIDRRSAAFAAEPSKTTTKAAVESKYAVGSTVQICWQQADTDAALVMLKEILTAHHLSVSVEKKIDDRLSVLISAGSNWQCLMLHDYSLLGDTLGGDISMHLKTSVLAFMEYQQDCWGYTLFEQGKMQSYFWNIPSIVEEEPAKCRGDAQLLARLYHVSVKQLAPYLRHITQEDTVETTRKVFSDDQYTLGDHWVRIDFMRRLGIKYPNPDVHHGLWLFIPEPGVNTK